ncbi:MAG: AhpC/TSA family protein [Chitinophaga sp.]|uniref:TlpA disulfide reductase family protein n=1 Tax=Chitinophaga sp. TaxID=1869181 RepID=UPI0025BF51F2|nr:TlpA disulfide reductase family protein [Chitinophaga sp.]MBV8255539.1 AhpC/TSA family protein [Chitinophaga sp.]
MLNKGLFLGLALCTALGANAQKRLQLDVNIKGLPEGDRVYLWAPLPQVTDSAFVKNGHFSFDVDMSRGGTTYILQVGSSGDPNQGVVLYLEAGKMNITGKGPYFKDAVYTGSPFVADWTDIDKNVMPQLTAAGTKKEALEAKLGTAVSLGDQEAATAIQKEISQMMTPALNTCVEWVNKHPNAGAGSFLINAYLSQYMSRDEMKDLLTKLGPDARNTFTIKRMTTQSFGGENMLGLMNKMAPGIKLSDNNGKTVSLEDFKGKYVLVDFWASWCKPCRESLPALVNVYNKYKDKGFTILSVSLDDKKEKWAQAIAEEKLTWPQVSDLKGGASPIATEYGVMAIPATFLVDPNGKIIALGATGERLDQKLAELIK